MSTPATVARVMDKVRALQAEVAKNPERYVRLFAAQDRILGRFSRHGTGERCRLAWVVDFAERDLAGVGPGEADDLEAELEAVTDWESLAAMRAVITTVNQRFAASRRFAASLR